jgi:atypical dual specificity phosphatase
VLAGMPPPFIRPERRLNMGGTLEAFDDELPMLYRDGIRAVAGLLNNPNDAPVFETAGFYFKGLPVSAGQPPSLEQLNEFVVFVEQQRWRSRPIAVYCDPSMNRTATMLAAYLIHTGQESDDAIGIISGSEPAAATRQAQRTFLEKFAKSRK